MERAWSCTATLVFGVERGRAYARSRGIHTLKHFNQLEEKLYTACPRRNMLCEQHIPQTTCSLQSHKPACTPTVLLSTGLLKLSIDSRHAICLLRIDSVCCDGAPRSPAPALLVAMIRHAVSLSPTAQLGQLVKCSASAVRLSPRCIQKLAHTNTHAHSSQRIVLSSHCDAAHSE